MQHLKQPTFYPVRGRNIRWNTVATVAINPGEIHCHLGSSKTQKKLGTRCRNAANKTYEHIEKPTFSVMRANVSQLLEGNRDRVERWHHIAVQRRKIHPNGRTG